MSRNNVSLEKVATPEFQNLIIEALFNKTILFLLDRNFASISQKISKNSLKKRFHLREKFFLLSRISDKWKNGFSLSRKSVSTRSDEVVL